jgi:hypothetical protein
MQLIAGLPSGVEALIHFRTLTGASGSYVYAGLGTTCRGLRRELSSERSYGAGGGGRGTFIVHTN